MFRAEQSRAEQSRAEQSRAEQSRADVVCFNSGALKHVEDKYIKGRYVLRKEIA